MIRYMWLVEGPEPGGSQTNLNEIFQSAKYRNNIKKLAHLGKHVKSKLLMDKAHTKWDLADILQEQQIANHIIYR